MFFMYEYCNYVYTKYIRRHSKKNICSVRLTFYRTCFVKKHMFLTCFFEHWNASN